jgi:hypothetical protein
MAVTSKRDLQETARTESENQPTLADLQLEEAKWVTGEHDEFIKLIQRYRSLYVTALFLVFGWALGRVLGSPATTLAEMRSRPDVAALLSVFPLINVLFALVMLEAHTHAWGLARYRFLLGIELYGKPPWRWNLWREKQRTSILQRPTMFLNAFSAILFLFLTVGALWFCYPALGTSGWLWALWGPTLLVFVGFLITVGIVALNWLKGTAVVTRPPVAGERWRDLWPEDSVSRDFVNLEFEKLVASTRARSRLSPEDRVRLWEELLEQLSIDGPPLSDHAVSRESISTREDEML